MNIVPRDNSLNPIGGRLFEESIESLLKHVGYDPVRPLAVEIGAQNKKSIRRFDIGDVKRNLIVECKSHRWTAGANAPSAKMSVWNEAMYYFSLCRKDSRRLLFVQWDMREQRSLADYYVSRFEHLIPEGVEVWHYNIRTTDHACVYPSPALQL